MSLIEQAALRLEALRKAGADLPQEAAGGDGAAAAPTSDAEHGQSFAGPAESIGFENDLIESRSADPQVIRSRRNQPKHSKTVEIDLNALAAGGYLTPDLPNSQIADELRVIKRPIIRNTQGKGTEVDRANL